MAIWDTEISIHKYLYSEYLQVHGTHWGLGCSGGLCLKQEELPCFPVKRGCLVLGVCLFELDNFWWWEETLF